MGAPLMGWFGFERPPAKAYWWTTEPNWGDALAGPLLERFAGLNVERGTICQSSIVTVGSVLEHISPEWHGVVCGTGKLRESSQLNLHNMHGKILGVRGPLTARQCPAGTVVLGDPGLLVPELLTAAPDKVYDLGIVPHWSDGSLAHRREFHSPGAVVKVIDPRSDPLEVVTDIARCHRIVTSSLHGAITADALGIPRRIEQGGTTWSRDGMFKWHDYHASIGMKFEPGKMAEPRRLLVADRQYELFDAYIDLGDLVREGGSW
jgi:pyruvyltransferase